MFRLEQQTSMRSYFSLVGIFMSTLQDVAAYKSIAMRKLLCALNQDKEWAIKFVLETAHKVDAQSMPKNLSDQSALPEPE